MFQTTTTTTSTTSTTTTSTTTTTTTTPPDGDTILALKTYSGNEGTALIRNDYYLGSLTVEITNFEYPPGTAVYYSCSFTWRNKMLVFGGQNLDNELVVENQEN